MTDTDITIIDYFGDVDEKEFTRSMTFPEEHDDDDWDDDWDDDDDDDDDD